MRKRATPNFGSEVNFISSLEKIVGKRHVLTGDKVTRRFRKGFRSGEGEALAVVKPGTLLEQWKVLQACIDAGKIVIMQAANTGLTEGFTPKVLRALKTRSFLVRVFREIFLAGRRSGIDESLKIFERVT